MTENKWTSIGGCFLFVLIVLCCVSSIYLVTPTQTVRGEIDSITWKTISTIEAYNQIFIYSTRYPPRDAYSVSKGRNCRQVYDVIDETWKRKCITTYSYFIDRWVPVREVVWEGVDRNPIFPEVELNHVEIGYGNERLGTQKTYYYVTAQFDNITKRCKVSQDLWSKVEEGMQITSKKSFVLGINCSFGAN